MWGQRREKGAREGDTKPKNKEDKMVTEHHVSRFHDFCPCSTIAETQWVHKDNPSMHVSLFRALTKQEIHICDRPREKVPKVRQKFSRVSTVFRLYIVL